LTNDAKPAQNPLHQGQAELAKLRPPKDEKKIGTS